MKKLPAQKNKTMDSIFCALVLSAFSMNGALADDPGAVKNTSAPLAFVGAITGTVFGTPIAIVRMSGHSMLGIYHLYDKDPLCWQCLGRPLALPLGVVEGTVKGCIVGPRNAFRYAKDKPFSKDSFSMEALD